MKEKKDCVITFRTTETVKKKLEEEAKIREWSLSQLAERIVSEYANSDKGPINFTIYNNRDINIERR